MDLEIVILAGRHERVNCIAPASLKKNIGVEGVAWFKDEETGTWYPADAWAGEDGGTELTFLLPYMAPHQEIELSLDEEGPDFKDGWKKAVILEKKGDQQIDVDVRGERLTSLRFNDAERPYLWPLKGPQGQEMTRGFPCVEKKGETKDHPHHRSVWTAYGEVAEVDHWSVSGMHGFQKVIGTPLFSSGVAAGRVVLDIEWRNKFGDVEESIDERREIKFYNLPRGMQAIDFDIKLMARHGDVLFGDTKEGGFLSVRVPTSMDGDKGGVIENAHGGKTEAECWGKRSPWVDYSGNAGGFHVGIAMMEHPTSFQYPTWWHVRDYGLFSANPFGLSYFTGKRLHGDYLLKDGDAVRFKYRLLIHSGDATGGKVKERFLDYIHPPEIKELDF